MERRYKSPDVACPTCGAGQGEKCRSMAYLARPDRTVDYHFDRRQMAKKLNEQFGR